tara:strand:+ start:97 stop:858 length:762 start_codon:yes stop_codon:yes gene_type:complete
MSYLVNPYMVTPALDPIDDTGLKAYYKFNETSGSIINVSESSDTLGSSVDISMTGGTYNQSQLPLGYSLLLDGINDFGQLSSSLSLWNFLHSSTAKYSICFWIRFVSHAEDDYVLASIYTNDQGAGIMCPRIESNSKLRQNGTNASTNVFINTSATSYISNATDYFFTFTYDQSLASGNGTTFKNASETNSGTKTGATPLDADSSYPLLIGKNPNASSGYGNFYISEMSIFSRVLSDSEISNLWNGGSGRSIY